MRKGMRRLDLWLPDNHPVFALPAGTRTPWVKEALDLLAFMDGRFAALEARLAALENRLAENPAMPGSGTGAREDRGNDKTGSLDLEEFFRDF